MKIVPILFAVCSLIIFPVQPSYASPPSPEATPSELSIQTADITDIEAIGGMLFFSAGGRRFQFTATANDEASAVAGSLAVLSELRRATTVSFSARLNDDPKLPSLVKYITFKYPSLKQ